MENERIDVLADLRGVVRIAKAASIGVTGNAPRIERAEQAIAAFAELIEAARPIVPLKSTADWGRLSNGHEVAQLAVFRPEWERFVAALARVQGGAA